MTTYAVTDEQTGETTEVPAETVDPNAQTPAAVDSDYVLNSQPVDAVAASSDASDDVVAPTTTSPDDAVATSSDVVGGPAVVDAAEVDTAPEDAPADFDGTVSLEDRDAAESDAAEVRAQNESDSKPVAAAQRAEDLAFRNENPDSPVARAANPAVGGEGVYS